MRLEKRWPHDPNDQTTWKYSDCIIEWNGEEPCVKEWILNPDFKYKYLDPDWDQAEFIKQRMSAIKKCKHGVPEISECALCAGCKCKCHERQRKESGHFIGHCSLCEEFQKNKIRKIKGH